MKEEGPLPEGMYSIDLMLNSNRITDFDSKSHQTIPNFGIQKIPFPKVYINNIGYNTTNWGSMRARITQISGNSFGRDNFYIHNSTKGFSHGCLEVGSGFFPRLLEYQKHYGTINLTVKYPSSNSSTLGKTWKYQPQYN